MFRKLFTFQYGQIYYKQEANHKQRFSTIYIPIWLDLLYYLIVSVVHSHLNLHSNMVRFIIRKPSGIRRNDNIIYIPIWLDLLSTYHKNTYSQQKHLHSNMVRFIIKLLAVGQPAQASFTFQYGQIYYLQINMSRSITNGIYIPIWLDLL